MDSITKEAALIMRLYRPKTGGEIFSIAKGRVDAGDAPRMMGECVNEHAWAVVDAHYANLNNLEYRASAGLGPVPAA